MELTPAGCGSRGGSQSIAFHVHRHRLGAGGHQGNARAPGRSARGERNGEFLEVSMEAFEIFQMLGFKVEISTKKMTVG